MTLGKIVRPALLAMLLMSSLSSFRPVLAQENKVDLTIRLLSEYYKELAPGENVLLFMEVKNNGNTAISNIRFNASAPQGWQTSFVPDSISHLSAGSSQAVDVHIVPGRNTSKGDATITLLAEADQTRAVTSTFLRVKGGISLWLWVGAGIGALVLAGFIIVFLRFGRE
ncbi:MAG: hypothetical protein HYX87_01030 [Chloroflexi bacterium]|nr:hypothetical protein [Chloroflexota bacterium]